MSLDVSLEQEVITNVFDYNITHNLCAMAEEAGIYKHLWTPEELHLLYAKDLIKPLTDGLVLLKSDRERFEKFDAENGWGTYDNLVEFVKRYIDACIEYPDSKISVSV